MPMTIKNHLELAKMREAGRIAAWVHAEVEPAIVPGVTTGDLEQIAIDRLRQAGATSSFYGYRGFPAHICASVNDEIVHGIPGKRVLREGDIISLDISAYYDGFHGDSAWTYPVGTVSEDAARLLRDTEEALYLAIAAARTGDRLGAVSNVVQRYARDHGYAIVRNYGGHGVGREMHEDPHVANRGDPNRGPVLRSGLTIAIEPMFILGREEAKQLDDRWTVVTIDGSLASHFEHTVAVTPEGGEILTARLAPVLQ